MISYRGWPVRRIAFRCLRFWWELSSIFYFPEALCGCFRDRLNKAQSRSEEPFSFRISALENLIVKLLIDPSDLGRTRKVTGVGKISADSKDGRWDPIRTIWVQHGHECS
jgi:hypothetical protein